MNNEERVGRVTAQYGAELNVLNQQRELNRQDHSEPNG
jgi:hypothetical protein